MTQLSRDAVARFVDVPVEAVEPTRERVRLADGRMTTALYRIRGNSDAVLVTVYESDLPFEDEICWVLESKVQHLTA